MMELDKLAKEIISCERCSLRETATRPVPGLGDIGADYFILGEAPGRQEDTAGCPFVGAAGKRLNRLLGLAGIHTNKCYITNVVKCRPPQNRTPRKAERIACYSFLRRELELVKPKTVIALGATPLSLFTGSGITQLHGTSFAYDQDGLAFRVVAQYHPAAALHQPRLWAVMLNDWENTPEVVDASYTVIDMKSFDINKDILVKEHPIEYVSLDTENDEKGRLGAWSVAFRDTTNNRLYVCPKEGPDPKVRFGSKTIMHNAKWDIRVLRANGMEPPKEYVDTMIAAYCMGLGRQDVKDNGRSGDQMVGGLGLKYLARRHLGLEMRTWTEVSSLGDHQALQEYNAMDSVAALLLWERWKPRLPEHFWKIDMPLLEVCMAMEDRGILVDPDFLRKYAEHIDAKLKEIDLTVDGLPLNPFSPKQVAEYVFNHLGYEPTKFTDTKQPSVDKEVLELIDDPIVKRILEYREYSKERQTYLSNYLAQIDVHNRIHCDFKQTSTATGRLSCARPNLQNVTKSDLRKLFIAPPGKVLVRMDFSQLELRVFAALTQAKSMLKALEEGRSIHQETADALGVPYDDAKVINFLMLYGGTGWKISQEFHIPIDRANLMIAQYYRAYPEIRAYHERQTLLAHEEKKVSTYFGRVRRLDSMFSEHWKTIKEGEREAINTPVQGTAAEVVKLAMLPLHYKYAAPILCQVHDELLFEVDEKQAKDYGQWLIEYIPTITEINGVSFPVEIGIGRNWFEAKEKAK